MKKSAFTIIEMIFVIAILGVVAGMTFVQVSTVYEDMMQKQNSSELESEAKVIAEQITARLSSSIKESLVAITAIDGTGICTPVSGSLNAATSYSLAWIGKSDEANLGLWDSNISDYRPGWSGLADLQVSDTNKVVTPGSKLSDADTIIQSLAQDTISNIGALYFVGSGTNTNACSDFFVHDGGSLPEKTYQVGVATATDTQLNFIGPIKPSQISEQYTLSHSAYAIERDTNNDLWLYEFRPWLGQNPDANSANRRLLGRYVSGFKFKWSGGLFRVNVCVKKELNGFPIEVCKEKAVF